jgi:AraC family transcriptional regulator of adaptative response / DNA-3-methyladenine glycosylase II
MDLDRTTCRRARLARDARFDGRFFVGVKTTRIFCRPICPAVPPRECNVEYFPTAAAAADAGFRACLRCRPECAPGTPAWTGASSTVARALRLIGDGALEADSIDALAGRLGIGARHLRRLFIEHLGASPVAVAQTRRLLSAKRLIDETDMPLTAIAMSAGYGSIRRFNAAFLASYGRSPRELRQGNCHRAEARRSHSEIGLEDRRCNSGSGLADRGVPRRSRVTGDTGRRTTPEERALPRYVFQLRYRPPFDWDALLAFLGPRGIPGVELVEGRLYRRSIEIAGDAGWFEVGPGERGALQLCIEFPQPVQMLRIVSRVRRMFDLDADPMVIHTHLGLDPLLAPLVRCRPGLRVPGAWDGFELGVRAILGQQVSVAAATTLAGRVVARFGRPLGYGLGRVTHIFPSAADIAAASVVGIGVPATRAEAVRRFAAAAARGDIPFDGSMDPAAFRDRLRELPGIGEWTAEYISLRALGDPDAFPAGDLGLLRATKTRTAGDLTRRAQAWRPWRAYAALHLWAGASPVGRSPVAAKERRNARIG